MPADIRPLRAEDHDAWSRLWADYYRATTGELPAEITNLTWARFLDPTEPMEALGAFREGGEMLGFATLVFHRSTRLAGNTCYLEDLYVDQTARRLGAGKALLAAIVELASRRAGRLYWITRSDNEAAQKLYGEFADPSGFIHYRLKFDPFQ